MTTCPGCQSEMSSDADYCGICGGRLPVSTAASAAPASEAEWTREEQESAIQELGASVARALASGASKQGIVQALVKNEWQEQIATQFVDDVEQALNEHRSSSEELSPEQQQALESAQTYVARALTEDTSKHTIVKKLVDDEWPEALAIRIVDGVEGALNEYRSSPEWKADARGKYAKHILFGALWAAGGTVVTLATYSAAQGGGTYFIAWGAMGIGALEFLYGVFGWLSNQ